MVLERSGMALTARYALFLKSRILGLNPCNVEMHFQNNKAIWISRTSGRRSMCRRDGALGSYRKSLGVPAWQLLGGRYRDKIRLYADTPGARDPQAFAMHHEKKG